MDCILLGLFFYSKGESASSGDYVIFGYIEMECTISPSLGEVISEVHYLVKLVIKLSAP